MDRQVNPGSGPGWAPKVVFIIRSYGFPEGMAATNRVRLLGRALIEQNADVSVICMRVSERPGEVRNHSVVGSADGIPFIYTPGSTVRSDSFMMRRWREARGYVRALLELRRLKARGSLDCVFLADGGSEKRHLSVYLLLRWLRLLGVPVITELNEAPGTHDWLPAPLSRQLSHLGGVDGAVAISRWLAEWAAGEARRIRRHVEIVEIPIVVDTREQAVTPYPANGKLFVYSASSQYARDLAFVFRSMRRVWDRFPEAELMVTGMQPQRVAVVADRENVRHAVNDGRLKICGYLERPALLTAYQKAAALVIPLHDDLRSRARFPTKIGEYLASGRPVVTSRVGEIERFLRDGDTAYVAAPGDVDSFAGMMAAVLEDAPRAASIGAAGRRAAEELFFYARQGIRLKSLIERVCGATTRPAGLRR